MDVIQEVGSYAGFAAVVGLAVLAALYFSQARDVRRLREWAGRAAERVAEQAVAPEQAAQEAARPVASGAVRPIPAAKPATAPKPATPGQPATAEKPAAAGKPATATPAGGKEAEKPGAAPPVPVTAAAAAGKATAAGPAPATPAAAPAKATPPAPSKGPDTPAPAPVTSGPAPSTPPARPPTPPPVLPARPAPPVRSPAAATASQSTAVLPASRLRDRARRAGAGRKGLGARYIALIVAGVIVIGGGAAFGISQLGGDDEAAAPGGAGDQPPAPINPSTVTVSVLNGTTVPGLAAQIGDEVESDGFQRGNVANALDQQRTTSVVLFAEGADREAQLVARRLGIAEVEPIDPDSQALGGNASVVVIVGADQTS